MTAYAPPFVGSSPARTNGVLRDPALDRQLREEGYAVVRFATPDALAEARRTFDASRVGTGRGFEADLTNPDSDLRRRVGELLSAALGPAVEEIFDSRSPFLWNFLCRWPDDPEDLYLHRDWMFVDERDGARSHLLWAPLDDVGIEHGPLHVLPRSHLLDGSLCGTGLLSPWIEHRDVIASHLVTLTLSAGEAVVFDHALVHGSVRNRSGRPRIAVGCAVRHPADPLVHFVRTADRDAARYVVDEEFFVTYTPERLQAGPPDLVPSERLPAHGLELQPEQLADVLRPRTGPPRRLLTRWRGGRSAPIVARRRRRAGAP